MYGVRVVIKKQGIEQSKAMRGCLEFFDTDTQAENRSGFPDVAARLIRELQGPKARESVGGDTAIWFYCFTMPLAPTNRPNWSA